MLDHGFALEGSPLPNELPDGLFEMDLDERWGDKPVFKRIQLGREKHSDAALWWSDVANVWRFSARWSQLGGRDKDCLAHEITETKNIVMQITPEDGLLPLGYRRWSVRPLDPKHPKKVSSKKLSVRKVTQDETLALSQARKELAPGLLLENTALPHIKPGRFEAAGWCNSRPVYLREKAILNDDGEDATSCQQCFCFCF